MAWIESHQKLKDHPKAFDLMYAMGWDIDQTIGKLHRFWWWCLDYAEDGDLRKHNDDRIAAASGVLPGEAARKFVEAMVQSRWIDREPYFRVHDWWEYIGNYLQRKYKNYPDRWRKIRDDYSQDLNPTKVVVKSGQSPLTNLPTITNHNQPKKNPPENGGLFEETQEEPTQKSPYKVDLSQIAICGLEEPAKHKLFNAVIRVFQVRGWDTVGTLPLSVFQTVAGRVTAAKPKDIYPYFEEALRKYVNENADDLNAQGKQQRKRTSDGVVHVADILGKAVCTAALILSVACPVYAEIPRETAIRIILTEAAGEPYAGKVGVAEVLRNRGGIGGFYGIKRKDLKVWLSKQPKQAWKESERAWEDARNGSRTVKNATLFENIDAFGFPKAWDKSKVVPVAKIGSQTFFEERKAAKWNKSKHTSQ